MFYLCVFSFGVCCVLLTVTYLLAFLLLCAVLLQLKKRDLFEKVHSQQVYKDEMETLQAQASKCDRLESEVQRYKKKAEDAEYMKKRIEELIHQNELMVETKALLEEKAASLATRAEAYGELSYTHTHTHAHAHTHTHT